MMMNFGKIVLLQPGKHAVLIAGLFLFQLNLLSQVSLRDTTVVWQHHYFELNDDHSMDGWTTIDSDIEQVEFSNSKVIENKFIRLVIVPEYGARIISFVYKPTGHEYLYESECGSPYGMNEGNFYYNWLMVWGGIFPTFPEPEHGKTWLLPWDCSVVRNNRDTVTIRMEYTDSTSYSGAPSKFNNGTTGITCIVEISVYSGLSTWDFDVSLKNNKDEDVRYEYWTCTTMTPGSEPGNTRSPLNSEIVVPFDTYKADWSPGGWIGNPGSLYDVSGIDRLSKWEDMGIAYAHNLDDNYWGVINHENEEGIFRISNNLVTEGMKFWTWGRNNIDNDLYDFSNGAADNYIELWGGVSHSFFSDATLSPNEVLDWKESYSATTGLTSISAINDHAAANLSWDEDALLLTCQLNEFRPAGAYKLRIDLEGDAAVPVADETITADPLGNEEAFSLKGLSIRAGDYNAVLSLLDLEGNLLLSANKEISIPDITSSRIEGIYPDKNELRVRVLDRNHADIELSCPDHYKLGVYDLSGKLVSVAEFNGTSFEVELPGSGLYIFRVYGSGSLFVEKVMVR